MNKTKIDAALKFGQDSLGLVATKIEIQFKYLHNDDGESSLVNNCITINESISIDRQILAIFHELVHFWQWKLDKLQFDLRTNKWIYNGVIQDGDYWHQKHEIEARIMSRQISREFNLSLIK